MAPRKRPRIDLVHSWIKDYDCFAVVNDKEIYCNTCSVTLKCSEKAKVKKHLQTKLHSSHGEVIEHFFADLCEAFVAADIPFPKLDNPIFRKFLAKYTNRQIPDQSTIRKVYLPKTYSKVMNKITHNIGNNYYWICADETTDVLGRAVCNVLVGNLNPEVAVKPFLIASCVLEHV